MVTDATDLDPNEHLDKDFASFAAAVVDRGEPPAPWVSWLKKRMELMLDHVGNGAYWSWEQSSGPSERA